MIEKVHFKQSSLLLSLDVDKEEFNVESGHQWASCSYLLRKEDSEIFGNLPELKSPTATETKMFLVYIAGFIICKDLEQTDLLETEGFNTPSDCSCQRSFSFLSYSIQSKTKFAGDHYATFLL